MSDRVIVRRITDTKVIVRQTDVGPRVIVRNMGPQGLEGDDGDSAYAVAVANGFVGSEAAWLASLVGTDGADGAPGAAGPGVAVGGTVGQFLRKQSGTNYDTAWAAPATSEVTGLDAALAAKIPATEKGAANGVASLDGSGKVPTAQLPAAVLGAVAYQGTWNATSNTPTIPAAAVGNKGYYYRVATAGSTAIDGVSDWKVGDWIVSDGTIWQKVDNTDPASVSDVPGLVTALGLKADQTALDDEETDRIAGDALLQAEIDALPTSGGSGWHDGFGPPGAFLGERSDYYLDKTTGDIYRREWTKPEPWAWAIVDLAPDFQPIATKLVFNGALWETSGRPYDLVSGEQARNDPSLGVLTVVDGIRCLAGDVDGQFNWDIPTQVLALDPTQPFSIGAVVRKGAVIGHDDLYGEAYPGGGGGLDVYWSDPPGTAGSDADYGGRFLEVPETLRWQSQLATSPGTRHGPLGAWATNGVDATGDVVDYDTSDNPSRTARTLNDEMQVRLFAILPGEDLDPNRTLALALWFQPELTQAEAETWSADPFGLIRQATDNSARIQWVLILEGATQAELDAVAASGALKADQTDLDAEATARGNADTTLQANIDGKQPLHANLTALAGLIGASDRAAYFTGAGALSLYTLTAFGRTLAALADASAGRTALAVVPGTDVQAWAAKLDALVALTWAADKLAYFTSASAVATTSLSSFIRTLLADPDAATAIATLGAVATGDSRLSDSRAPNGAAGGSLGGTYPNPSVAKLNETSGPTALTVGAIADGEVLTRVGSTVVGSTPGAVPADDSITNAKLANMATATMKGRKTAGTGDPEDLSASDARTNMGLGSLATVTPTGTPDGTKFLRDDNSWQAAGGSSSLEPALFYSGRLI